MKFTIVTVTYNAEATIERALRSVVGQRNVEIEFIIVDGKSTDRTMQIVETYSEAITCIISEKDSGIYDAMNKGIAQATGDYVYFLNADDYFVSDSVLVNLVEHIRSDSFKADIYHGSVLMYWPETGYGKIKNLKEFDEKTLYRTTIPHQGAFFRTGIFEEIGLYDLQYLIAADYEFFVRAYKCGKKITKVEVLISVFLMNGFSGDEGNKSLLSEERRRVLEQYFSNFSLFVMRLRVRLKKLFGI